MSDASLAVSQKPESDAAIVTGGSRGLGRGIVEALVAEKLRVTALARHAAPLEALKNELGVDILAASAADEAAASKLLKEVRPNLLVLCAGASPPLGPIHLQTWESFSHNWEVDTKSAFVWLRQALKLPMAPGSHIILISSGAAVRGSPASGGYAPAKRAQWFIADYASQEAARMGLKLHFHCLLPMINPSTELGRAGIAAYAERTGVSPEEFIKRLGAPVTPAIMGQAILELYKNPERWNQLAYLVSGEGLKPLG
jgi:NAD(P)-dependent dehydrogenase (short-subunit alcohol dehydrogenase family)